MDVHPEEEYDFLPTLPELCEKPMAELKQEIGYIFTLYGFALGYLAGCHPARAWLVLGTQLIRNLNGIEKSDWDEIQMRIADKLEERFLERSD